jgi:hypothetical protein
MNPRENRDPGVKAMKATSRGTLAFDNGGRYRPALLLAATMTLAALVPSAQADEPHSAQAADSFAARENLSIEEMAATRGREGSRMHFTNVQSIQEMQATVTDSRFQIGRGDMVSGNISFGADALGSYSGTGIFNAVTGNGNAINNAVGISVFIAD